MVRRHDGPDLRADVPTLEPDDAFLARLSELAAGSGAGRPPAGVPSLSGWRVGLAAASVVAVVGGIAALATAMNGDEAPTPPTTPATQPTDPAQTESDHDVPTGGLEGSGAENDETAGPFGSDPGGSRGSVGSAPEEGAPPSGGATTATGGPSDEVSDEGPDEAPGQGPDEAPGQGPDEVPGDVGASGGQDQDGTGQAGEGHGQAGQDHGQQDGLGDEGTGQDGEPHGQAGEPRGPAGPSRGDPSNGGDRAMGER